MPMNSTDLAFSLLELYVWRCKHLLELALFLENSKVKWNTTSDNEVAFKDGKLIFFILINCSSVTTDCLLSSAVHLQTDFYLQVLKYILGAQGIRYMIISFVNMLLLYF